MKNISTSTLSLLLMLALAIPFSGTALAEHKDNHNPRGLQNASSDADSDQDEVEEDDEEYKDKKYTGKSVRDARGEYRGKPSIAPGQFVSLYRIIQASSLEEDRKNALLRTLFVLLFDAEDRSDLDDVRKDVRPEKEDDDYRDEDSDDDGVSDEIYEMIVDVVNEFLDREELEGDIVEVEREDDGYEVEVELDNGDILELELNEGKEIVEVERYEEDEDDDDSNEDDEELTDEEVELATEAALDYVVIEEGDDADGAEVVSVEREDDGYEVEVELEDGTEIELELDDEYELVDYDRDEV